MHSVKRLQDSDWMFELNAGAERTQTQGTVLHPRWEGWFPWLLSLIRRAIKEVEEPTKGGAHTPAHRNGPLWGLGGVWFYYPQSTGLICLQRPNYDGLRADARLLSEQPPNHLHPLGEQRGATRRSSGSSGANRNAAVRQRPTGCQTSSQSV